MKQELPLWTRTKLSKKQEQVQTVLCEAYHHKGFLNSSGSTVRTSFLKAATVLPSYEPEQQPAWHNNPKDAVVAHVPCDNHNSLIGIKDPLKKRGAMHGTGNLVSYSEVVKSWVLKENMQPRLY